ncbi:DUF6286 domain-containing protein [Rhodococcus sp. NPDC058521]|uniref:DUF6286 domain-containing protein n=1 Tax=Rhodococcus sp. NPDC058521 TaxID=3346536 RepID=UPI00366A3991
MTSDTAADTEGAPRAEDSAPKVYPAAGRQPVAAPAAGLVGAILSLGLLAAGIVGIRDAFVAAGWLDGEMWTKTAANWIDGLTFANWMIPAGIAAVIVGLWFLIAALKPRRKTAIPVDAQTSVWIPPADVARISSVATEPVSGVMSTRTTASRKKVVVASNVTGADTATIKIGIAEAVREALSGLKSPPKITVRTKSGGR